MLSTSDWLRLLKKTIAVERTTSQSIITAERNVLSINMRVMVGSYRVKRYMVLRTVCVALFCQPGPWVVGWEPLTERDQSIQ
jgi:hypothetical protein